MKANTSGLCLATCYLSMCISLVGCVEQKPGVTNGLSVTTSQPGVKAKIGDDQKAKTIVNHNERTYYGDPLWKQMVHGACGGLAVLIVPPILKFGKEKLWKSSSPY